MTALQKFRELQWTDYIKYVFADPAKIAYLLEPGKGFLPAALFVPIASAGAFILASSSLRIQNSFFFYKMSYGWIMLSVIYIAKVVIIASLLDMIMQFTGKSGSVVKNISIIALSYFPSLFIVPAIAVFTAVNFAPAFMFFLLIIFFDAWGVFIVVRALSELYRIQFSKSLVIYFVPFVAFYFTLICFFIISVIMMYGLISSVLT